MSFAIIGKGKTGGELLTLLPEQDVFAVFDSKNRPTAEKLKGARAAIAFVPGEAILQAMPELLAARIPLVIGATGFSWPEGLDAQLRKNNIAWIAATNFSLGMNLCFSLTRLLAHAAKAFPEMQFSISETHHVHKKDSPSGTALTLQKVLTKEGVAGVPIQALREGDVRGIHTLRITFPEESLELRHEASERSLFARGAIFAARDLLPGLAPGFHHFEDLMDQRFRNLRS